MEIHENPHLDPRFGRIASSVSPYVLDDLISPHSEAYKIGNSAVLAETHHLMARLTAALRNNQWISALALFKATVPVLPTQASCGVVYLTISRLPIKLWGYLDEAVEWDEAYTAWRVVIAHALALMHKVMREPGADIAEHVAVLEKWRNLETGASDPLVECWLLDGGCEMPLPQGK